MASFDRYERNRQILFDTMYSFADPFTVNQLEDAFNNRISNGFRDVDKCKSLREVLRDLEMYGLLKKEGPYYEVLDVDLSV